MAPDQKEQGSSALVKEDKHEAEKPASALQAIAEGSVSGQVACNEGPVFNATVSVGLISTYTDPKGNFLLEHVQPGIVKIRAKPPTSRFNNYERDILIEAGKKKEDLFIFLSEVTGTIEGVVTDENGKPLFAAEISGLFRLAKPPITSKTDEKGHYVFTDIPRGSYYVRAQSKGHMIEGASVNVTGGSTVSANFTLRTADLAITGKVVSKNEAAPLDCDIYLMRKGVVVTKLSNSRSGDGSFMFDNLVPDIYEIGITAPGYTSRGWRGKLDKSEAVNFELEVEPQPDPSASFNHM